MTVCSNSAGKSDTDWAVAQTVNAMDERMKDRGRIKADILRLKANLYFGFCKYRANEV